MKQKLIKIKEILVASMPKENEEELRIYGFSTSSGSSSGGSSYSSSGSSSYSSSSVPNSYSSGSAQNDDSGNLNDFNPDMLSDSEKSAITRLTGDPNLNNCYNDVAARLIMGYAKQHNISIQEAVNEINDRLGSNKSIVLRNLRSNWNCDGTGSAGFAEAIGLGTCQEVRELGKRNINSINIKYGAAIQWWDNEGNYAGVNGINGSFGHNFTFIRWIDTDNDGCAEKIRMKDQSGEEKNWNIDDNDVIFFANVGKSSPDSSQ